MRRPGRKSLGRNRRRRTGCSSTQQYTSRFAAGSMAGARGIVGLSRPGRRIVDRNRGRGVVSLSKRCLDQFWFGPGYSQSLHLVARRRRTGTVMVGHLGRRPVCAKRESLRFCSGHGEHHSAHGCTFARTRWRLVGWHRRGIAALPVGQDELVHKEQRAGAARCAHGGGRQPGRRVVWHGRGRPCPPERRPHSTIPDNRWVIQ